MVGYGVRPIFVIGGPVAGVTAIFREVLYVAFADNALLVVVIATSVR